MSITPNDLVLYGGKDGTYSGGYKIDGFLKSQGISPLTTFNNKNNENLKGGKKHTNSLFDDNNDKLSGMFSGLGIPAGLSNLMSDAMIEEYINNDSKSNLLNDCQRVEGGLVEKSLFDKLLALSEPSLNPNMDILNDDNNNYDEIDGGSFAKNKKTRITRRKNTKQTKQSNSSSKKQRKTRKGK